MDLSQILINAQSPDNATRSAAEAQLQAAESQNLGMYLLALAAELCDNNKQPIARRMAGIVLKNRLDAKDSSKKAQYIRDWLTLDPNLRNNIKNGVLQTLGSPVPFAWQSAAQVCAKIGVIELPENHWPNLIDQLLHHMSPNQPDTLKCATLNTLGYLCEEISYDAVKEKSNLILTAVVQGMRKEEANNDVKLAAAKALENALEFAHHNFENQNERDYIMKVVCDSARSASTPVKVAGYECLVKIATLYYEKLPPYMQEIFIITLESIKKDPEPVALQAIEFWSTICDEEVYLLDKADEDMRMGLSATVVCHNFVKGALKFIVPIVLETLTKQSEDAEDDTWDVAMAGATCLNLIANVVNDEIIPYVVPFVQEYITNQNWHFREAAVMAFGSILEGPKELVNLIRQALPVLIQHMKDGTVQVKDTAAWTLGRVCQLHPLAIRGDPVNYVMQALLEALGDSPKVASNACWAFQKIAEAYYDETVRPFSQYSPYFQPVVMQLLRASERNDSDENNLRASAYEAINAFIMAAPDDCKNIIGQLVPVIIERLAKSFAIQTLDQVDRDNANELQALLCGVMQSCIQKLDKESGTFSDQMMELFLRVFSTKSASVHEEALMAVGALCNAIEADFEKYLPSFRPFLITGLRNYEEYQVCIVAVGVVGDVCRALQRKVVPYCDEIVSSLVEVWQKPNLNRSVRPAILACFGDIGLSICGEFTKYLQVIMSLLHQASLLKLEPNEEKDDELIDSLNSLREGVFQAYTGIIQGLRTDNQADNFLPYLNSVTQFAAIACHDKYHTDEVVRAAIGVLGDLAHALGAKVKAALQAEFIKNLIVSAVESDTDSTREVGLWAQEVINKL